MYYHAFSSSRAPKTGATVNRSVIPLTRIYSCSRRSLFANLTSLRALDYLLEKVNCSVCPSADLSTPMSSGTLDTTDPVIWIAVAVHVVSSLLLFT